MKCINTIGGLVAVLVFTFFLNLSYPAIAAASLSAPACISPAQNATVNPNNVTFAWGSVPGAAVYDFRLWNYDFAGNWTRESVGKNNLTTTSYNGTGGDICFWNGVSCNNDYPYPINLASGSVKYRYRILARNAQEIGPWADCNFTTADLPPSGSLINASSNGCQVQRGTYSDPDFPNSSGSGSDGRQVDVYINPNGNESNFQAAGAKYANGDPMTSENVYLGFAKPDTSGMWSFDPQTTINYVQSYRVTKPYNAYDVLFTDAGKIVNWKITAFVVDVDASGQRADGLLQGTPDFSKNRVIPGNFYLTCQKPSPTPTPTSIPTPTPIPPGCDQTGDLNGDGKVDIEDFNAWREAFTGQRGVNYTQGCGASIPANLKLFNIWRNKNFKLN